MHQVINAEWHAKVRLPFFYTSALTVQLQAIYKSLDTSSFRTSTRQRTFSNRAARFGPGRDYFKGKGFWVEYLYIYRVEYLYIYQDLTANQELLRKMQLLVL
jgi:hypothetical protein